ncbi:glycoside hydrolase [Auriculariales sp. MPI-PUGE-AT-0066]|nr:glycoside hydrolase [Auriculariales sp. MPI-PUGE-AT-0066]
MYLDVTLAAVLSALLAAKHVATAPSGSKTVIIQMFEWSWASVASECTNFIGPAGYGFVQVSPPQEHITGSQWWTDYQPVSYILTSKRGNRTQFANMVTACHNAGVGVIVDTIWNHMAGIESGTGIAGSSFTHYNYPGIYQTQDFHHCGLESGDEIINYNNRVEVQTCELVNLADLATDTEYVRGKLAAYGNDLISLGADGFRLDAAKHIAASDISNIIGRLSTRPYITQEVIFGSGEPVQPSEYTGNGDVQEFRYTTKIKSAFESGISSLQTIDSSWIASSQANVFVTNHDTERNLISLTYKSPSNTYVLATIFSLAYPYGTPSILSSYEFSNNDAGAPNSNAGTCSGTGGSNGWLCQHRWLAFTGLVGFRNAVGSAALANWRSDSSQRIAFSRGSIGFVAINNQDDAWSATFTTGLPAGTYCDVVAGIPSSGTCLGAAYTVSSSGTITASISARNALAIFTGAPGTGSGGSNSTVTVNFAVNATTTFGDNIFVTGSISQLSNWSPDTSIALSSASYPIWTASVSVPAGTAFSYKYLKKTSSGSVVWESDPNRSATAPSSGSLGLNDTWR